MAVLLILMFGIAVGLLIAYVRSADRSSEHDEVREAELRALRSARLVSLKAWQARQALEALAREYEEEERRR